MRILYLTQWFDPEPNVIKGPAFVRALQAAGHDVTVVTGYPNYPTGRIHDDYRPAWRCLWVRHELRWGIRVVRLPLYPSHDANTLRRSLNYLGFFATSLLWCLRYGRRFDLAYVYHPPITVGLAAALSGMVTRLPYVLDVQDLWPDTLAATGMRGARRLIPLLGRICALAYRRARLVLAPSAGIAAILRRRGVPATKLAVVLNWAQVDDAGDDAIPHPALASAGLTLVYGGNLGLAQGLDTVIAAMRLLPSGRDDIRLIFHGDGVDADQLRTLATGLATVQFGGVLSRAQIAAAYRKADVLLLHLRDDPLFAVTIPSKVQAYLAAGRPILAGIAGDAAALLTASGAATIVPPGDAPAMAAAILHLADLDCAARAQMGTAGRKYYEAHLTFPRQMDRFLGLIERENPWAAPGRKAVSA